jgi:hypothetical protein
MNTVRRRRLLKDLIIVALSIFGAVYIGESALLIGIFGFAEEHLVISSFIGGLFFTSVFTTVPAMVFLGKLALTGDPSTIVLWGAFGAMVGDLVIFRFIRDHLFEDVGALFSTGTKMRFSHIFEYRFFRWSLAVLGALVISSPLPDELGLAMMGMTKMRTAIFLPISFVFNGIGIFIVGYVARGLVG